VKVHPNLKHRAPDLESAALYGRPFRCKACGSGEVTLFAIESQAELDAIQQAMARPKQPAQAPTTHARPDPDWGLI
jgi:hypothetical protein